MIGSIYENVEGKPVMKKKYREKPHQVSLQITGADIEKIVVAAVEGAIRDWAELDTSRQKIWAGKPHWLPTSRFATQILIRGGILFLADVEDSVCRHELDLTKLLKGVNGFTHSALGSGMVSIDEIGGLLDEVSEAKANTIFKKALFIE